MASTSPRFRPDGLLAAVSGWPRRLAALACLLLAAVTAVTSHSTAPIARSPVVLAARALSPGTVLSTADLVAATWPAAQVPSAAVVRRSEAIGRAIGAGMTRGEPITAARLLDSAIASALAPGQVAITVGLISASQAAILQAGALVDLYLGASDLVAGSSVVASNIGRPVATAVRVLAVLPQPDGVTGGTGPSVVLAADRPTATALAEHPAGPFLATLVPP